MPTPEENMQSVRTFVEEVFGNKNLTYATDWLADDFVEHQVFPGTTPDKKGAIDSYRIFFAASPDMTADIHDMVAVGDKVAIRATYRGTDQGGFIPGMPATGNGGHVHGPDQQRGTDRRALGCRRHHRNDGTARPPSASRVKGTAEMGATGAFKGEALGSQTNQAHAESHLGLQAASHPIHVSDHVVVSDHGSLASDRRAQSRPARGPAHQVRLLD